VIRRKNYTIGGLTDQKIGNQFPIFKTLTSIHPGTPNALMFKAL